MSNARGAAERPEGDRVSVVLATYNGSQFLAEQLNSLLIQTRRPDEIVIVDDFSSDRTPKILEAFAQASPVEVDLTLRREHRGTWATFEETLRRATGDIVVICDQDDRWAAQKIEVMASRLASRPDALMAFSDARLIDSGGSLIGRSRWRIAGFSPRNAQMVALDPFGQLLSRQAVSGCTMAIRSELVEALLPFPSDVHSGLPTMMYDRWISLIAAAAAPVVTVPEKLVDYRIHPAQQIGIPALPIRKIAPRAALRAAQFLHGKDEVQRRMEYHLAHLELIEKRLADSELASGESDARLRSASAHLAFRASLDVHRRVRVRAIADEFRRIDGYRRFSLGVASAVADAAR